MESMSNQKFVANSNIAVWRHHCLGMNVSEDQRCWPAYIVFSNRKSVWADIRWTDIRWLITAEGMTAV